MSTTSPKTVRLTATETRDGLRISLDLSYKGKLPNAPARKKVTLEMARRVVAELEAVVEKGEGRLTEIGSADNSQTFTRRNDYLVEGRA